MGKQSLGISKLSAPPRAASSANLVDEVDLIRINAFSKAPAQQKSLLGQFPTPPAIANFMAAMFTTNPSTVRLLDPGAGAGSLAAAVIASLLARKTPPEAIEATAFEIDAGMAAHLRESMALCDQACEAAGVPFRGTVQEGDFIQLATEMIGGNLFGGKSASFNYVILNPPYKKINTDSDHRRLLRAVGVETSNLYTAFLALSVMLLEDNGELVAITPRSFCNGPYFKPFRQLFLREMSLRRIHVFESRTEAFSDDDVLQENIIFHAVKTKRRAKTVIISASHGPDEEPTLREVATDDLVKPNDPDQFIHIVSDDVGGHISDSMGKLTHTLLDLGLSVSTGRVVDFRSRSFLKPDPGPDTAPLIYPTHFSDGWISWPKLGHKKPNACLVNEESQPWLIPAAIHVLVKRFSAKEEKRRVVAAIFDPTQVPCEQVAFENHLNYYHAKGKGLTITLAKGLAAYLNSTVVDSYFRQFNGHTQVNATDLRNLKYPSKSDLEEIGHRIGDVFPTQIELDRLIEREFMDMAEGSEAANALGIKRKIDEALEIIKALGMPREQQNERSALTLLALLDLKPDTPWKESHSPYMGITPMMDYFSAHFAKKYAPNSRETVRRFTIHQFEQAGLVVKNPDKPRAINSPDNVYQIESSTLELLKTFGSPDWEKNLSAYFGTRETLKQKYAAERVMHNIPVVLKDGRKIELSPGGQNVLIKEIIDNFCRYYTPGGDVLYVGDAGDKFPIWEKDELAKLGVTVDEHGKMPDVVVFYRDKGWLILIEAVTSHGPVNAKRHKELKDLFKGSTVGLVFVTAFLDRKAMVKYLSDISWETEVWVADAPTHLIHFNGERFLGPYNT